MQFEEAAAFIYAAEVKRPDGWTRDPEDPGGATRWGLSSLAHPDIDLQSLDQWSDALPYYRDRYWRRHHCGEFPDPLDAAMLDTVVQHSRLIERWQERIGVVADNLIGPQTIAATRGYPLALHFLLVERSYYYDELIRKTPWKEKYRDGWRRRLFMLAMFCEGRHPGAWRNE